MSFVPSHLASSHNRSETNLRREFKRAKPNSSEQSANKYLPRDQLDALRLEVYELVDVILQETRLAHSYEWYYNRVQSLCKVKYSEQADLATKIFDRIRIYYNDSILPVLKDILNRNGDVESTANEFLVVFNEYEQKLFTMRKLFLYFDKSYLLTHPTKSTIIEFGYCEARKNLLNLGNPGADHLIHLLDSILNKVRTEMFANDSTLKVAERVARIVKELTPNTSIDINKAIFKDIKYSCAKVRPSFFHQNSSEYLYLVLTILQKEVSMFEACRYSLTFIKELRINLLWEYLFYDFSYVLDQSLTPVIQRQLANILRVLVQFSKEAFLYYGINAMKVLRFKFLEVVKQEIDVQVKALMESHSKNAIISISESIEKVKQLEVQMTESEFDLEVRNAVSFVFAKPQYNDYLFQQLSKYCDTYIKSELTKTSSPDTTKFQQFIKTVVSIFNFFKNKADFITTYRKDLSRRLLLARSFSSSTFLLEELIVQSFLDIVGFSDELTSISGMLSDFKLSKEQYTKVGGINIEFNALVLDSRNWPEVPKNDKSIIVPESLQSILQSFGEGYKKEVKQNSKVLDWTSYSLHQVTLTTQFDNGEKDLYINLLQATVILLFQEQDSYSFEEIQSLTNIETRLLKVILGSFTTEKYKVLLQDTNNQYTFNRQFSDKSSKIRLPISRDREVAVKVVPEIVAVDRQSEIRAAIARIMKQKRTMNYVDLIAEAVLKIENRAPVTVLEVKKNIENLIEFNLLERQPAQPGQYEGQALVYVP